MNSLHHRLVRESDFAQLQFLAITPMVDHVTGMFLPVYEV